MCLLLKIDRYLRVTKMSRSAFGRRTVNDPRLVTDMMRGRIVGQDLEHRIERFMAERRA
jgi:hypothetical protein